MSYLNEDMDNRITCVTFSDTRPVARKEHTCSRCRRPIPPGMRYRRRFMLVDGDPWFEKTCRDCQLDDYA